MAISDIDNKLLKLLDNYDLHCQRVLKATSVLKGETPAARAARIKLLESDYKLWFEYYLNHYAKVECARFHIDAANEVINNNEVYLLLEVYRSGGKSVHVDIGIPLHLMVKGKLRFMLLFGLTEQKAKKLISGIQAELKYNKRFVNDYGEKFKAGDWSNGNFVTTDGVRFMSMGFGQDPRGLREMADRPDLIVFDDVDNKRHVNNDRIMEEAVDFINEDAMGCFDESDTAVKRFIFANNNFHKNSITNRLERSFKAFIQKAKDNGDQVFHKIIKVKAVADLISFLPSWISKTSAEYWIKKFKNTPYRSFMREYMHVHVEDGNVFRMDDMQWTKMLNYDKYDSICLYGDLSYKDTACHKGMFLMGKIGRDYHIIHSFLRQTSRAKAAKWLYDLYEDKELKKYPRIRYYIEGLFSMDDFVNDFDNEGDDRGYHIPVIADKQTKADKYDRIEATEPYFERRNVFFNIDEKDTADQIELLDQYMAFEKGSGSPVDGPDACEGGFSKLSTATRNKNSKWSWGRRESRQY